MAKHQEGMAVLSNDNLNLHPEVQRFRDENDLLREELTNLLTESEDLVQVIKPNLLALYQTKIGAWELTLLQRQCDAARRKRRIELIRASLNRGEKPDMTAIEGQLELEFLQWQIRLREAGEKVKAAEERLKHLLSPEADRELKSLYYALVKKLHPDLHPQLTDQQRRLWLRVQDAYESGDLKELRALAVLVEKQGDVGPVGDSLDKLRADQIKLQQQIEQMLKEIESIKRQPPFPMQRELENDAWVAGRRKELESQCAELEARIVELAAHEKMLLEANDDRTVFGKN